MEPISPDAFLCLLHKVVNMATYGVYSEVSRLRAEKYNNNRRKWDEL